MQRIWICLLLLGGRCKEGEHAFKLLIKIETILVKLFIKGDERVENKETWSLGSASLFETLENSRDMTIQKKSENEDTLTSI